MAKQDGGPAFPAVIPLEHDDAQGKDYPNYSESGMSLRDYFAGQALAGYLSIAADPEVEEIPTPTKAAEYAYRYADAMLAERGK